MATSGLNELLEISAQAATKGTIELLKLIPTNKYNYKHTHAHTCTNP